MPACSAGCIAHPSKVPTSRPKARTPQLSAVIFCNVLNMYYLEHVPCPLFDTNRAAAAAWLRELLGALALDDTNAEHKAIGIKSSYVLVPDIKSSRPLAPQHSLRDGTGFLQCCFTCQTPLSSQSFCPTCGVKSTANETFDGKMHFIALVTLFQLLCVIVLDPASRLV